MAICRNKVVVWVARGSYGHMREVEYECGNTGPRGQRLMCKECEAKARKEYPQGWRSVPGDTCKHGNYVGDAYGPDYMCPLCEMGDMKFYHYVNDSDGSLIVCEACHDCGEVMDLNYDEPDETFRYSLLCEDFYPGITCGLCGHMEEKGASHEQK